MTWLRRLLGVRVTDSAAEVTAAPVAPAVDADRLLVVQRLLEAAQAASNADASSTTADMLDRMIEQIKAAFGARHACIHFVRDAALDGGTSMHAMQFCPVASSPAALQPHLMGVEMAIMQRALAAGRPLHLRGGLAGAADVASVRAGKDKDDAHAGQVDELALHGEFQDGIVVPVAYQGDAFAWINVYVPDQRVFDEVDQGLLRTVGGVLYGAVKKEAFVRAIQRIRATLETHFSPRVVDKLVSNPEDLASQRSERLEVSVLFSDIRGFTALSEQLEPDVVAEMVSEHLEAMAAVVFAHDGIVDKYIGDSVMAVFGSPFPQDDHAQRAVAAALAMMDTQRSLQAQWADRAPGPLAIGVGVNTGVAIVGDVGVSRREFTHLGDTVNLASRLKDVARPWQVLIGQGTYEHAKDTLEATPLPPLAVKGKAEPVLAYEVARYTGDVRPAVVPVVPTPAASATSIR